MGQRQGAKRTRKPDRIVRVKLPSQLRRKLDLAYGKPITEVVRKHLREGLSVTLSSRRILRETGIGVHHASLYKWLGDEADQGRPVLEPLDAGAK